MVIEVVVGILMTLTILLQSPKTDSFGNLSASSRMYRQVQNGMESGLNRLTLILASIFIVLAFILGIVY